MRGLVRLYELDGVFGIAALAARRKLDELALTRAYTRLGEALGLDWAQQQVARFVPPTSGSGCSPPASRAISSNCGSSSWHAPRTTTRTQPSTTGSTQQRPRIEQFRQLIARARTEGHVSAPMLAQIAGQARILLAR